GCSVLREFSPRVEAQSLGPGEYIALKRGDILTTGELGAATRETLRVAALDGEACAAPPADACTRALASAPGLSEERRLAALAELWTQQAMALAPGDQPPTSGPALRAWLEAARHAYAYLFFSERAPGERAFEDRQTQVRDYYNHAVQQAAIGMFARWQEGGVDAGSSGGAGADVPGNGAAAIDIAGWTIRSDMSGIRMPEGVDLPQELVPASALNFAGLRSIYRRDGFGAEVVAVMGEDPVTTVAAPALDAEAGSGDPDEQARGRERPRAWSEMPSPALTLLIRFPGDDLA